MIERCDVYHIEIGGSPRPAERPNYTLCLPTYNSQQSLGGRGTWSTCPRFCPRSGLFGCLSLAEDLALGDTIVGTA